MGDPFWVISHSTPARECRVEAGIPESEHEFLPEFTFVDAGAMALYPEPDKTLRPVGVLTWPLAPGRTHGKFVEILNPETSERRGWVERLVPTELEGSHYDFVAGVK